MGHDELASSLANHLLLDSRMVWEDINAGKGGSMRPDVFTIEKSYANPKPTVYEVKVSVSDFRSDITSGKWQKYFDIAGSVVFATPKGLISRKDVPDGCGLIQFNGVDWVTLKRARAMKDTTLPAPFLLKLLMDGADKITHKEQVKLPTFDELAHEKALKKKFGKDIREKISRMEKVPQKLVRLQELREELAGILELEITSDHFETLAGFKIRDLKKISSEDERRKAAANEVRMLQRNLNAGLSDIIRDYTGKKPVL